MSQRLTLEPGEVYSGTITVATPSDATGNFSYVVSVTPYSVVGEEYAADLTTSNIYSEIADWTTIENPTGTLAPNESTDIHFTIRVPESIHGGGQYATIMVSQDPSTQTSTSGATVQNLLQIASVIYADIGGEVDRTGEVLENNVPTFAFSSPIDLTALIANHGNIHTDTIFDIKITNNFTGELVYPDPDSEDYTAEIIMPETTRYIVHQIGNLPPLGSFKVSQTIYYGDSVSTVEKDLIICPLWFIFLVLFAISSVIIFIVLRIRTHRRTRRGEII